jgi:tetratricopeptide (TPR) repeat protein
MKVERQILESNVPFAESIIWQLNRSYYQQAGLSAWSEGVVPHNMTSSAFVGKTYAGIILGFLKDVAAEWQEDGKQKSSVSRLPGAITDEKVYIIELGSGHGRLAFHILQELEYLMTFEQDELPSYCLILTDIVESNLHFFQTHPQFKAYIDKGKLDVAYFDGVASEELVLRHAGLTIQANSLTHPMMAIANYFFDSLPNDLYRITEATIAACHVSVFSELDVKLTSSKDLLENLTTSIHQSKSKIPLQSAVIAQMLKEYDTALNDTYLLMPRLGMECIDTLKQFSLKGLVLISMDKGYSEMLDLDHKPSPELVPHGSFSLYVNFHALSSFCDHSGGRSLFASFSDFSLKLACLLFLPNPDDYKETYKAYHHYVNDFGPDDFIGMKNLLLRNGKNLSLRELISTMRMGCYDSTLFIQMLPHIKQHATSLSLEERKRLGETLTKIGDNYFAINEAIDTTYEIGGLLYDLGFYQKALRFFNQSMEVSGELADLYYNIILCLYQLRKDKVFSSTLTKAQVAFPHYKQFSELEKLDLSAE